MLTARELRAYEERLALVRALARSTRLEIERERAQPRTPMSEPVTPEQRLEADRRLRQAVGQYASPLPAGVVLEATGGKVRARWFVLPNQLHTVDLTDVRLVYDGRVPVAVPEDHPDPDFLELLPAGVVVSRVLTGPMHAEHRFLTERA